MTVPRGFQRLDPESVELGKPIGRSWERVVEPRSSATATGGSPAWFG